MSFRVVLILILSHLFITSPADAYPVINRFNVCDFGAVGDGQTKATAAIQAAIDSCALDGGQLFALKTLNRQPKAAVVALHNSTNFVISRSRPLAIHDLFCRVTGSCSKEIYLNDNILSAMTKPVHVDPEVTPATIHHNSH